MRQRHDHYRKTFQSLPFPAWLVMSLLLPSGAVLAEGEQWGIRRYAEELPRYQALVQQLETEGRRLQTRQAAEPAIEEHWRDWPVADKAYESRPWSNNVLGGGLRQDRVVPGTVVVPVGGVDVGASPRAATENRSPKLEVTPHPTTFNTLTGMDIVRVTVKASDPDGDEVTLEFQAYDDQRTMVHREEVKLHSSEETITRTFSFRAPGTYGLIVQASDGMIAVQWHKRVVITGNRPPELTVHRGEPVWDAARKRHHLEVNVEIVDPDAGDSISGSLQVTGPSGSPSTHVFNLKRSRDRWTDTILVTMDQLGGYTLEAVVKDTRGAEARWNDQVAAFNPQNRSPTLKVAPQPIAFNRITERQIVRAVVEVADPDGDQVTLEFRIYDELGRVAQREVKLYSAQETITRTFSFGEPGTYLLFVQASDGTAATQWQQRVTIPERPSRSESPTLEVVAAVGYNERTQQHSIEAGAVVRGVEAGATAPVYFQLYDKDGRIGEMRVKLDPTDGTAMTIFHVTEIGTYEVKVVTQVAGHDLQGSDTVQVRERRSPDPNERSTDQENPETQGTSEVIMTIPDVPLDLENTGGFEDLPAPLLPDADPNEDVQLEPVEFIPDLVPRDDGTIWLAPDEDGFGDLGDTDSRPSDETVTYFDRQWIPRTWQTGDTQLTQVNIYDAATCLATAAALANYTEGASDTAIADHIQAAIRHMQAANRYSFAPHKAWPDWEQRAYQFNVWARRITQESQRQRDIARRQLHGYLNSQANAMKTQLETLLQGQAGSVQNCDSLLFQVGHHLAYAAQLQLIAEDGLSAGKDQLWANRIVSRVNNSKATAARLMGMVQPSANKRGCPDMKDLAERVRTVRPNLPDAGQAMLANWQEGRALLEAGGASEELDMEAIGRHVFAGMEGEVPPGATIAFQGKSTESVGDARLPAYVFSYRKPLRFQYNIINYSGFNFSLIHGGADQLRATFLRVCRSEGEYRLVQREDFERHDGTGMYCLTSRTARGEEQYSQHLFWTSGEWTILMHGFDWPNHPDSMFGGHARAVQYMFRILDRLAPRLKTIPRAGGSQTAPPQVPVPGRSPGGMDLSGIEGN